MVFVMSSVVMSFVMMFSMMSLVDSLLGVTEESCMPFVNRFQFFQQLTSPFMLTLFEVDQSAVQFFPLFGLLVAESSLIFRSFICIFIEYLTSEMVPSLVSSVPDLVMAVVVLSMLWSHRMLHVVRHVNWMLHVVRHVD